MMMDIWWCRVVRKAFLWVLAILLAQAILCNSGGNSTVEVCEVLPRDRLDCGRDTETELSCQEAGCCFDTQNSHCYFPQGCRLVLSTAGGYSAFILLPGKERHGSGSMAMLEGGTWCARNVEPVNEHLHIELELVGQQTVYVLVSHALTDIGLQPFNVSYTQPGSDWLYLQIDDGEVGDRITRNIRKTMTIFQADNIRIHPEMTTQNPCIKIEFVTCAAQPLPPRNTSKLEPRVNYVIQHEMISPDAEPVSIFIGVVSMASMLSILGCIVLLDIPTLRIHFGYMIRNIKDFKDQCQEKTHLNGHVTYDVAEAERTRSLNEPDRPESPYSEEDQKSLIEHESSI